MVATPVGAEQHRADGEEADRDRRDRQQDQRQRHHQRRFDLLGFALLSLSIGALQMLLDRGQLLDWFASLEIIIEALLAGFALYLFVVHIFTHDQPFIEPGLFKDRNFSVGLVMIFVVDMLYLVLDPRIKYREAR